MMRHNPFFLGLEHLFHQAERTVQDAQSYPPRNVTQIDDETVVIEFAVAGYDPDTELKLTVEDNYLVLAGGAALTRKIEDKFPEVTFNFGVEKPKFPLEIHHGISRKSFVVRMWLGADNEVKSSEYKNGILTVTITSKTPEKKKPKQIAIKSL